MTHPWKKLIEEIRNRNWTQKQFAVFVWKKNSEVNELIKWKRNITIQWDLILSEVFWTPEKYWINMQTDYDYEIAKKEREKQKMEQKQEFEIVSDIEKDKVQETESSQISANSTEKDSKSTVSEGVAPSLEDKKDIDSSDSGIIEDEIQQKPWIEKKQDQQILDESQPEQVKIEESEEKQKKKEIQKIFINF